MKMLIIKINSHYKSCVDHNREFFINVEKINHVEIFPIFEKPSVGITLHTDEFCIDGNFEDQWDLEWFLSNDDPIDKITINGTVSRKWRSQHDLGRFLQA